VNRVSLAAQEGGEKVPKRGFVFDQENLPHGRCAGPLSNAGQAEAVENESFAREAFGWRTIARGVRF
jgi:hypothetical protein